MAEFYDFLGHKLNEGDRCVYLQDTQADDGTAQKCMTEGVITGFSKRKVKFEDTLIYASDIVKVDYEETRTSDRSAEPDSICISLCADPEASEDSSEQETDNQEVDNGDV